jgi:DNA segregation ATPase FtsK/SpoIIIE, S-DNA-T family
MAKAKSTSKEKSDFIKREIIAALLFTVGLFSSLSLIFYSTKSGFDVKGAMGTTGVFISDILGSAFGIASFVIPVVMFYTAILVFVNKPGANLYRKSIAAFIFLFSTTAILGLIFGSRYLVGYSPAGGWVGNIISSTLKGKIAGTIGSYMIVTILIILSLIILSNLSLSQILDWSGKTLKGFVDATAYSLHLLRIATESAVERLSIFFKKRETLSGVDNKTMNLRVNAADKTSNNKNIADNTDDLPQIVIERPSKTPDINSEQLVQERENFKLPHIDLLDPKIKGNIVIDKEAVYTNAKLIEEKLSDFGVSGKVTEIRPGPVITMFEYKPSPGIKINKISSLSSDLAMGLSALSIRIIAPIPGRDVIGIEVPNAQRETVVLRELLESSEFMNSKSMLTLALGKDISGIPFYMDLRRAPHLMIAGTTGSGKSVFLHTVLASMLFKATPYELKFIMIDPKMLELSIYEDIPHLLHPVVTNPKEAAAALRWAVKEMELRYKLMSELGVRDIESYNNYIGKSDSRESDQNSLPYIVIIIDELADLMMIAPAEIRESITRLSQMARAAGIHLIVATQRPSVDIVAGLIKANFPARISFLVSSRVDSRIILDSTGAEQLLGKGDMLFLQPGTSKLLRIQGALISDEERESITEFLKSQAKPEYNQEITKIEESDTQPEIEDEKDELYLEALRIIAETRQASISMLQRKLKIGYNRAARIVEIMEKEGVIGPQESAGKPREVFIDIDQVKERQIN